MDLTDADYEQVLREGLPYQKAVALKPGRYQVRLAAREDATGLLGSAWQWVEIPDLAPGRLALSSLFLLKESGQQRARRRARTPPPRCSPPRRSADSAAPRASTCSSTPTTRSGTLRERPTSSSQAEVLRGGVVLGTAAPEPMEQDEPRVAGSPHLPDQAPALRARRLRAAGHRHRPQRERDGDAPGRVHGRLE